MTTPRLIYHYSYVINPSAGLGDPQQLASRMRADIEAATGCTASAGIGPNLLLARLATRRAKPNGQFMVAAKDGRAFLSVRYCPACLWSLHSPASPAATVCAGLRWAAVAGCGQGVLVLACCSCLQLCLLCADAWHVGPARLACRCASEYFKQDSCELRGVHPALAPFLTSHQHPSHRLHILQPPISKHCFSHLPACSLCQWGRCQGWGGPPSLSSRRLGCSWSATSRQVSSAFF